jgi:uncharacterized protein (TIGR00661 family)
MESLNASRILYGVQGEGRGHATRSLRVIEGLLREGHDVLVLTGGDALPVLASALGDRVLEIPLLRYHYNPRGALCAWRTLLRNALPALRMAFRDAPLEAALRRFRPDAAVSDFEPVTCRLARTFRLPLVAVDHQHFLTETALPRVRGIANVLKLAGYRFGVNLLSGWPRRVVVSSFHHFPKKRGSRAAFVGPFLPEDVKRLDPREGEGVTVYLKRPQYLARLLPAMAACAGREFEVFSDWQSEWALSLPRNVTLRPVSREAFLRSLAACRALVTTAGNQVLGEAIWLGKPALALPETGVLEQDFNARALEESGCGMSAALDAFTAETWHAFEARRPAFLRGLEAFKARHPRYDGLEATLRRIRRLLGPRASARVANDALQAVGRATAP